MSKQRNTRKVKARCLGFYNSNIEKERFVNHHLAKCRKVNETADIIQQQSCLPASESTMYLFKDALHLWIENNSVQLKESTLYKYNYLIETHIKPDLGDLQLDNVNATAINAFLANKLRNGRLDGQGGLSNSYVRSIMLIINSALNFAFDQQMCPPMLTQINKPPLQSKELQVLDCEHQKKLEETLLINMDETKLGIFISLYTGLRLGEICALTWDDIDLNYQVIHVRHTVVRIKSGADGVGNTKNIIDRPKTKTSLRCVPICSKLLPILLAFSNKASSRYVVSSNAEFVSPRTFAYRYNKVLVDAGVPYINFHALRHTFATRCIESGVDVKSLSEILGHANVSITLNTYVHSSMNLKRLQLEKMATSPI